MNNKYEIVNINDYSLNIYHDNSQGYAGIIWDCAYVFSSFLSSEKSKKYFKNKVVLEIGSGTGLCGLIVACLEPKRVYLTDKEENLKFLERNVENNKDKINCDIVITSLDWNYIIDFKKIKESFDIIIASDIIYHGVNFSNILQLLDHFSTLTTQILLSYNHRINSSFEFFDKLEEKWKIKKLPEYMINEKDRKDNIEIYLLEKKNHI